MTDKVNPLVNAPQMVTIAHIREARICCRGAKLWFERHGFSFTEFLENGATADELEATGDPLAFRVTALARKGSN